MNPTIGISGVATSGKDTFGNILIDLFKEKGYNAQRFALADELKKELREFILTKYNIDVLNCTLEQKTLVRPFLVFHGEMMRLTTDGTYWLERVDKAIEEAQKAEPDILPVITDVRYAYYPNDEFFWIKQKRHGLVVHVERYTLADGKMKGDDGPPFTRQIVLPANEVEAKHDGALRMQADFPLTWPTAPYNKPTKDQVDAWCRPYVAEFFDSALMTDFLNRCQPPNKQICP